MNLLDVARQYLGTQETQGSGSNATILSWANELGIAYSSDAVPWCALFASYILYKAGYDSVKSLRARDFLKAGTPVTSPEPGDIAVLWRDSPTSANGHVGIVSSLNGNTLTLLGGNQSDSVSYANYPTSRVLGYRRLAGFAQNKPKSKRKYTGLVVFGLFTILSIAFYLWYRNRKKA